MDFVNTQILSITQRNLILFYSNLIAISLFPDGVKHRVYNSRSMTDVESRLEVLLLEESDRFVSYSCIGINSQGAAEDRVDIEVIEKQPAVYDSAPQKTEVETRVQLWDTNEGMSINVSLVVEFLRW